MAKDGKPSSDDITKEAKDDDRYLNLKSSALEPDEEEEKGSEGEGDGETDYYDTAWEAMNGGDQDGWKAAMKKAHGK